MKSSRSAVYRDGCHVGYTATGTRPCVYGDRTSSRTVVLFGDSHAAQWFPALQRIATARGWKLISMTKASCKVADVTIGSGHKPYTACDTWRSNAMARIRTLRPDLVVVSSSDAGDPARPAADPLRQWTTGFENTFRDLAPPASGSPPCSTPHGPRATRSTAPPGTPSNYGPARTTCRTRPATRPAPPPCAPPRPQRPPPSSTPPPGSAPPHRHLPRSRRRHRRLPRREPPLGGIRRRARPGPGTTAGPPHGYALNTPASRPERLSCKAWNLLACFAW
ncbi:SGNH hydrolase domain-containing protein [Streptomyces shenzhenensis]